MKLFLASFLGLLLNYVAAQDRALFVKQDLFENLMRSKRDARQQNADQMVQNILQWLQGVYTQNSRRIRQGTLREYLPPSNTQKPRPFEPVSPEGYPPAGITPQPPFPIYTNPTTGAVTGEGYPSPTNEITPPDLQPNYNGNGYPTSAQPQPPFTDGTTGYPSSTTPGSVSTGYTDSYPTGKPGFPTGPPPGYSTTTEKPSGFTTSTGYPSEKPGFSTYPPPGYSTEKPGFPTGPPPGYSTTTEKPGFPTAPPPGYTSEKPGFPTAPPPGYTSEKPGFPTAPPPGYSTDLPAVTNEVDITTRKPSYSTYPPTPTSGNVVTSAPSTQTYPSEHYTSVISTSTEHAATTAPDDNNVVPTTAQPKDTNGSGSDVDEDLKHPPHIHAIDVQCAKDMMTINIEFNRQFDGVIYSKGYFNMPECIYVKENSAQTKYSFTVNLNTCGTEFINAFDTQGQSYLENVLVLQNEPGIQEVWDTIRSVRCLWEGNLKESLSVALSVGMLSQEIVTFSGDTAMAKLDIQLGKGPFAQPANGLVKIGETMTLVVSVSGDPGFDIQVKDCRATDSTGDHIVPLTDDNGCILKPKLFGAFQKTRETGTTGASIIAYAFFNAFKFPDVMDLMIECNIELCKTDCEMCPDPDQKTDPGRRRRRDLYSFNSSIADGVTMGKHLRVILPEDLNDGKTVINLGNSDGVCMSTQNFVFSSAVLISVLTTSCLFSAYLWLKNQRLAMLKS